VKRPDVGFWANTAEIAIGAPCDAARSSASVPKWRVHVAAALAGDVEADVDVDGDADADAASRYATTTPFVERIHTRRGAA
jgi:hypothetical protein